ncbi:Heavy metal-associated isoprenylated plant protein, partial [Actinidia chinensis var. chinensis]
MESASEVGCVLKVNIQCDACQMKLLEVLRSISGNLRVYSVTLDAEEGLAKISGEMDPNILLWALARNGKHAELKWVSLKSTTPKKGYYNYNNGYRSDSYNGYSYGTSNQPYRNGRTLPERSRYDSHQSYCPQSGQYHPNDSNYRNGRTLPERSRYDSHQSYCPQSGQYHPNDSNY